MTDSVALTALIVSLVALFTTIGQLLQQYLATADGYRRCQPSVMGLWAKRTRLHWRWREFRFETTFVVPRIKYGPVHAVAGTRAEVDRGFCSMTNTEESLKGSMTYPGWESLSARRYYDSDQLASWVTLLAQLHMQGGDAVQYFPQKPGSVENDTMIPLVQFCEKSWDFIPLDIVRPLASSTVSDIAIMARRLGMVWKTFDPGSGSLRAEGNGHVFTSTMVRSLGTVIEYSYTARRNDGNCFYIPVKEADKLGFGLVDLDHRLFGPEIGYVVLDVGSAEGISRTLPQFLTRRRHHGHSIRSHKDLKHVLEAVHSQRDFVPGLNDLVPICSAMLSISNAPGDTPWQVRIPAPNTFLKGVTSSREGFRVFEKRLEAIIAKKPEPSLQSKSILQCLQTLQEMSHGRWESEEEWDSWSDDPKPMIRASARTAKDLVRQYHSGATKFLRGSKVNYYYLVIAHIRLAFSPPSDAHRTVHGAAPKPVEGYGLRDSDPELLAIIHSYFDKLPTLIENILPGVDSSNTESPTISPQEVEDAWLSMMFRAFCWQRSHIMISGVPPLPSEHWNSKMPVYIG